VLTVAHVDAEAGFSGGEAQVFLLMEKLAALGWRSVLCAPPGSESERRARERGIEFRAVSMRSDLDGKAALSLASEFRSSGAALAHLHTGRATWLGGWGACMAGIPAITTRRMDREVKPGLRTRLVHGTLTQRSVAISPAVAERLKAGGVEAARIALVPSAVDPAALRPRRASGEVRAELGTPAGSAVVLALGALVPRKGHDVLLEALARLAGEDLRPECWIAGEGPERAALVRQAAELGLDDTLRLLGRREDVADLLAAADLVAMPSRREGLGVAALEAMAAAGAVVASRTGGLGEAVVDGRTGLLVPPGDPAALAAAIGRLLRDRALRERLARAGPARVAEGFLPEQMAGRYDALYREVIERWTRR
jgi:glycosyltransferase involved in cell wall biosynthesis